MKQPTEIIFLERSTKQIVEGKLKDMQVKLFLFTGKLRIRCFDSLQIVKYYLHQIFKLNNKKEAKCLTKLMCLNGFKIGTVLLNAKQNYRIYYYKFY